MRRRRLITLLKSALDNAAQRRTSRRSAATRWWPAFRRNAIPPSNCGGWASSTPRLPTRVARRQRRRIGSANASQGTSGSRLLRAPVKSSAAAALHTATELRCDNETVALLSLEIGRIEKLWLGRPWAEATIDRADVLT